MPHEVKVFYAPDTSDHPNWGCRFMGEWYRRRLTSLGARPTWILGSRWFFGLPEGMRQPRTWADVQAIGEDVRNGRLSLGRVGEALAACDVLWMNGENFIRPGVLKGRLLLVLAYLASEVYGKRCVLTNVSLDLSDPELATIARHVLPRLAEVHVREAVSLAAHAAIIGGAAPQLYPDPAWAAQPRPPEQWVALARLAGHFSAWPDVVEGFDPSEPYLTLGASSAFSNDQAAIRLAIPAFIELARRLRQRVPQVLLTASCEVDAAIMRTVAARTGLPLLGLNVPVVQAIDVLANSRLHVGGRWHPGIFASTGGTPLLALGANSHKMHTLMQQLQADAPVFDPRQIGACMDEILLQADRQLAAGDALRGELARKAAAMASRVETDFAALGLPG